MRRGSVSRRRRRPPCYSLRPPDGPAESGPGDGTSNAAFQLPRVGRVACAESDCCAEEDAQTGQFRTKTESSVVVDGGTSVGVQGHVVIVVEVSQIATFAPEIRPVLRRLATRRANSSKLKPGEPGESTAGITV